MTTPFSPETVHYAVLRLPDGQIVCDMDRLARCAVNPVEIQGYMTTFVLEVPRERWIDAPHRMRFTNRAKIITTAVYHIYLPTIHENGRNINDFIMFLTSKKVGRMVAATPGKLFLL